MEKFYTPKASATPRNSSKQALVGDLFSGTNGNGQNQTTPLINEIPSPAIYTRKIQPFHRNECLAIREDIAIVCNRRKVPYMPGCASLTEIGLAEEKGGDIIKLFPGSVYGSRFINAILGPQPWTTIMVTGDVDTTQENLSSWYKAGAVCVGI